MRSVTAGTAKGLAILILLLTPLLAAAQAYPSKPIRLLIPLPPGGITDTLGRAMATELTKIWGQPIVVENRPGANQIIATEILAKSPPDGYTMAFMDRAPIVLSPFLYSKLPYDPVRDLAPVIALVNNASVLVANVDLPVKSLQEFVAWAKARPPGEINYGTLGPGSNPHLDTEAFAGLIGVKVTHVPYKGLNEVLPAVMSNQIQIAFSGLTFVLPLHRQNRIRVLAVGTPQRTRHLPDIPTFIEAGFPGFESHFWLGALVPAGTPRPVIDKLAADMSSVISQKTFGEKFLAPVALELLNQGPDEFARLLAAERARYGVFIKKLNIRLD